MWGQPCAIAPKKISVNLGGITLPRWAMPGKNYYFCHAVLELNNIFLTNLYEV